MITCYDLELAKNIRRAVSSPISILGGAGNADHVQHLIDAVGVVGAAAGSMFVLKEPYRAALIDYARPSRLC